MKKITGKYEGIEHRGNDTIVANNFLMEVNIINDINKPVKIVRKPKELTLKRAKATESIPNASKSKELTRNISKPHSLYSPRGGGKR